MRGNRQVVARHGRDGPAVQEGDLGNEEVVLPGNMGALVAIIAAGRD